MSWLKGLFGGASDDASTPEGESYKGFTIYPNPIREGKIYRVAARITGEVDGDTKVHDLIRADTLGEREAAAEASLAKAKQVIDQLGHRLFD